MHCTYITHNTVTAKILWPNRTSIADGKAEAIEFHVEEKKPYCDKPLKNMKVKQNILVACITHGGVTELPGGDSVIREGDTVVVVTTRNDIIYKLDDIFEA